MRWFQARRPGSPVRRGWRRGVTASGLALLLAAWLPSLLAGLLAFADAGGEHQVLCVATEDGFEVTLHHPSASGHHHTPLERVLLGAARDGEPDHHLHFALTDRFSELSDVEVPSCAVEIPRDPVVPVPCRLETVEPSPGSASFDRRGPPPPWRGVVMTI